MYYDDEYELLVNKERESDKSDIPKARAYILSNGDVFTVYGKDRGYTLQFESNLLYEVVSMLDNQSNQYSYDNGQFVQIKWERTGVVFTVDELNNLIMR